MILSNKMTALFIKRNIISEQQREIYRYGVELILDDIVNIMLIIGISFSFKLFFDGMIFLICFISTRVFCGGFHSRTRSGCRVTMIMMFCCFVIVNELLEKLTVKYILVIFIGIWVPVIMYAPVICTNKKLSKKYIKKNRIKTFAILGIWTIVSSVFIILEINSGKCIVSTMCVVSVGILIGKFWRGGEEVYEYT